MTKKKECFNCKYREFSWSVICDRDGELIAGDCYDPHKKPCKYYKRDFKLVTCKGIWKGNEDNSGNIYEWYRGKFKKINDVCIRTV